MEPLGVDLEDEVLADQEVRNVPTESLVHEERDSNPRELAAGKVAQVKSQLANEIPRVVTAHNTMRSRVDADASLLVLAGIDTRVRNRYLSRRVIPGTLRAMRKRLVLSIVGRAIDEDITLADPANIEDLRMLVDRRHTNRRTDAL